MDYVNTPFPTPMLIFLSVSCFIHQRNLTELIVAVDVGNLLQLYASMLFERRILIFASKLSTVNYTILFYPLLYFKCIYINFVV